ncbi:GGDEF domain-containing protein [Flexibacterium corallicola]|uniref:GGDEF domain-containing protein n=1 Tax=Flexibacterium corallicola TaxID=3037259 RepID=UPI00286F3A48|nr:GGDEF domain-containing protein [Pseudovibrio sp. M1P-2-3]
MPDNLVEEGSDAVETAHLGPLPPTLGPSNYTGQNDNTQPGIMFVNGNEAGQVYLLDAPRIEVGRAQSCRIKLGDNSVSRRHLLIETTPDGVEVFDLKSRNGVFVNNRQIKRCWLTPNDIIRLGPSVILRYALFSNVELEVYKKMYQAATLDPLTQTYNRRYFNNYLEQVQTLQPLKKNFSLILIDVDHFKRINDRFGHQTGDRILLHIADILRSTVRVEDVVCRYGGEEFTVLLNAISARQSAEIAENIRNNVECTPLRQENLAIHSTVSIGIAMIEETDGDLDNLLKLADTRMYAAKKSGRNLVGTGLIKLK